jgi:hypothetical protein
MKGARVAYLDLEVKKNKYASETDSLGKDSYLPSFVVVSVALCGDRTPLLGRRYIARRQVRHLSVVVKEVEEIAVLVPQ